MMCWKLMIILAFVLSCTSSAKVIRTVAANGQGIDRRGCGVEGNIYCNTTQFAIFESNNGDEIVLLKGIHTCDTNITTVVYSHSNGGIRFVQRDGTTAISGIFIHGANNTRNDNVIYDCKHTKRAFAFMSENEGLNTVFSNFSIFNGSAYVGGGVHIESQAQPIFNHVIWIRNVAQGAGGGVFITSSNTNPTFNNCTFQENEAPNSDWGGGGVYIASQAQPIFNHVIWIRNVAHGFGGGVFITNSNTKPTFNNCTFQENEASDSNYGGGGVHIESQAQPIFNHVIWIRNVAQGGGGGVYIRDSNTNPTFNNCTFQENEASNSNYGGGGVYIRLQAQPIFNHVIWIRNVAQGYGGGVYIMNSNTNPTFNNCTFQENEAPNSNGGGGGVLIISQAQPIFNHVIWIRNVAPGGGGGVFIADSNTKPTFNNCTFQENEASGGSGVYITSQAQPIFNHVIWIRNVAQGYGGGVYIKDSNTNPTFNNCTFQENEAQNSDYGGGGVHIQSQAQPIFNHVIWIRNVAQGAGGGVYITSPSTKPTFNNCTFQENEASDSNYGGGGVYIQSQAQPIFNHVIWIRNVAPGGGGGVYIRDSNTKPITFNNCTFQENKAPNSDYGGGGVYIKAQAQPIFNHVIWIRNVAQGGGGGVLITDSNTNPKFNNCTFQENKASNSYWGGGGVWIQLQAQPIFNHVIWIRNVAQGVAGGVYITSSNTKPTFNNCTFQENKASNSNYGGGGVYITSQAQPIFNHVIWIRNVAQGAGGGVYITSPITKPTFNYCTFQNNTAIKGGGAIRLPFYPDSPPSTGECGTSLNFTSKTIFSNNKANYNAGNSIYIDIIQPSSVQTPMKVYFAPTCFHNKFITYINQNDNRKQHANINYNIATSPYKLTISKPGTLIPTSISPGIQLKGSLQVQDVFGRSCTEIQDNDYSATVRLQNDQQINFQGSTVFLIRKSGIANISHLNELKIISAPSTLIGKQISLQFTQEKLQSVNTTITLRQCRKGFQSSTSNDGVLTCNPCPAQQYNVISGGICHDCPTIGAVCMGQDDVYVQPGYYGHIDTHYGEISVFECSGGQCCPHFNGSSLKPYDINGIGCRIGSGYDCATNRDPSTPLCGSCISGYSEVLGSSICRKCTYIKWFWFIIPFPIGMISIIYLLHKTYLAATKNILFTLIFKNLMFFYQVVGLVLSPSQLVKRVSGPLLMLFSFNVATNEADHSDSNSNDKKLTTENPFSCLIPNLTPIGKLAFNIYPMGILMLLCWPICIYIFRKNEKKRANFGPAITTCLLSLYASIAKFLIQLLNCRVVGDKLILYSAPEIICFKDTSWIWQLFAIIGIIGILLVPYLVYRYAKLKREAGGVKNNRWMLVVTKSYNEECWWYTSIDMGRRLFLIIIAALPMNHENKLVMLTLGFLLVRTVHSRLKPFPHVYLNNAEDVCLGLLVFISAIASSRAASLHKNTDGTYDHPMDPFLLILVLCPFVGSIFFSAWYRYMERKKGTNNESTTEEGNHSINRTWAPNPLENAMKKKSGENRKTSTQRAKRASDIELVVDGLGEFHLDALKKKKKKNGERR